MDEQELVVLNLLADSWNEFCKLPVQHPDDARDFADTIHTCQRIIMGREAVRRFPGVFTPSIPPPTPPPSSDPGMVVTGWDINQFFFPTYAATFGVRDPKSRHTFQGR